VAPHDVRVITIAPGAVGTELLSHTASDTIKSGCQERGIYEFRRRPHIHN
jgi:NADP-dependent 3-hydroxy acid dehydrogenase YdfG